MGQMVISRQLGQSISKTAALVGCSRSAEVSIYQKWSRERSGDDLATGTWAAKAQLMHVGSEGWLSWKLLWSLSDALDKQVQSLEASPHKCTRLLTSWRQTPQRTFGVLAESMSRQVRAVFGGDQPLGRWCMCRETMMK